MTGLLDLILAFNDDHKEKRSRAKRLLFSTNSRVLSGARPAHQAIRPN